MKKKTWISLTTQVIRTAYGHQQFPSQYTPSNLKKKDLLVPYLFHLHGVNKVGSCYI